MSTTAAHPTLSSCGQHHLEDLQRVSCCKRPQHEVPRASHGSGSSLPAQVGFAGGRATSSVIFLVGEGMAAGQAGKEGAASTVCAANAATPREGGTVCQPGRSSAQGQRKGYLPRKSRNSLPQQTLQAHRPQQLVRWTMQTPAASSALSCACTEATVGAVGTFGFTTDAVGTFRPLQNHHPTLAMERPWICGWDVRSCQEQRQEQQGAHVCM